MAAKVFVDTNVFVYSRDASEPPKQAQAMDWLRHLWNRRTGRLSYQVLQEFYITVTEKLDPGLDRESARRDIRSLLPWRPIAVDKRVFDGAWHIQDHFGLSWWDALIVPQHRCPIVTIYSQRTFRPVRCLETCRSSTPSIKPLNHWNTRTQLKNASNVQQSA